MISRTLFSFALLLSTVLGVRAAAQGTPQTNYSLLNQEIRAIIAESRTSATWGVCVREIDAPVSVVCENERRLFMSGATQMLLTTAAALDRLGPEFRFRTSLAYTGTPKAGVVNGNLIVRGRGDPTLGGRLSPRPDRPEDLFRQWAGEIKRLGAASFNGILILDDTYFDDDTVGPQWPEQETGAWYTAEVSALCFNENCVTFVLRGKRRANRRAACRTIPPTDYALFNNSVLTGSRDLKEGYVRASRQFESNLINLTGVVPRKKEMRVRGAIHNPPLYVGSILRKTLAEEGIAISGGTAMLRDLPSADFYTSGACPVVVHVSPPLSEIVEATNRNSQTLYAEAILKTLGKEIRGEGSFRAGSEVVVQFLKSLGIPESFVSVADGSGLSMANTISPQAMSDFLVAVSRQPSWSILERSLESAGNGPNVGKRLEKALETDPAAPLRIGAVQGGARATYSMAGYATTAGGQRLAFSFCVADFPLPAAQAYECMDRMALALARSALGPGL
ncbi:D-alanyl-D-alanine carboxypeptidase/D-alanyl-D-alanine-endopeptidase [Candidatus Sumerlaeota bacterium]|nr:D-alanyl-D-alanine carboxypeptidase/D-alanyl-D-alanine-endopeptidase [Candidatus Sumerlaeota bacterium]